MGDVTRLDDLLLLEATLAIPRPFGTLVRVGTAIYQSISATVASYIQVGAGTVSGVQPADVYMDPNGDDLNDGLTVATPIKTLTRLLLMLPTTPSTLGVTTTVHMAAGDFPMPALFQGPFRATFVGTLTAGSMGTVTGVTSSTAAAGIVVDIDGTVPSVGALCTFNDGALAGQKGTVYSVVGTTVKLTTDNASGITGVVAVNDTISFYGRLTRIVSTTDIPYIEDMTECIFQNIDFGYLTGVPVKKQWFVQHTAKLVFEGCSFGLMAGFRVADGGDMWLINCFMLPNNDEVFKVERQGHAVIQRGTVIDGSATPGQAYVVINPAGTLGTQGEVVFKDLNTVRHNGLSTEVEGGLPLTGDVWRFVSGSYGVRFNNADRGSGGGHVLPNFHGALASYAVTGTNGAKVVLGPLSTLTAGSADDGSTASVTNADGTFLRNAT